MVQREEIRAEFSQRLKKALSQRDIAEWGAGARLAEATGKTAKAASKWLNEETMPGRDSMVAIADWLNVRVEWLAHGDGSMTESPKPESRASAPVEGYENVAPLLQPYRNAKEYPLISWVAAGSWQESCDNFQPGDADEWLLSDVNAGPHGYWLQVKGPSMLPTFTEGMRILVKPEGFDLVSGKFYIARLLDTGETTFKQYIRDSGLGFLQPLNPAFPTLPVTDNVQIIGQVVDGKLPPIF